MPSEQIMRLHYAMTSYSPSSSFLHRPIRSKFQGKQGYVRAALDQRFWERAADMHRQEEFTAQKKAQP